MIHTCDKHQPGRTCYIAHKCRCDGCRTDATAWTRRWKWRKQHGGSIMVPADGSTAENVRFLSELGESDEAIAHRLGIDVQSVQRAQLREAA